MTCRIFISFATGDEENATSLYNALSRLENVEVYLPERNEKIDRKSIYAIRKVLNTSDAFISIITFNSTNTILLNQEIGYACAKNLPMISIVEKGIDLEGFLKGEKFITFKRGDFKHNIYQTISRLRDIFPQSTAEHSIIRFVLVCPHCNKKSIKILPSKADMNKKVGKGSNAEYLCQQCHLKFCVDPETLSSIQK